MGVPLAYGLSSAVMPDERSGDPVSSAMCAGVGGGGSGSRIKCGKTVVEFAISVEALYRILRATAVGLLQVLFDRWTVPFHILI